MQTVADEYETIHHSDLVARGERFYEEKLKLTLEPSHAHRFVAIEPDSERYFLGDTGTEALVLARTQMPDNQFYLARIGHRAAHTLGGHAQSPR